MENDTRTSYGIELFANKNGSDNSHGIPVEEIGHTLSADLFYEKNLGHIAECYSGNFCVVNLASVVATTKRRNGLKFQAAVPRRRNGV